GAEEGQVPEAGRQVRARRLLLHPGDEAGVLFAGGSDGRAHPSDHATSAALPANGAAGRSDVAPTDVDLRRSPAGGARSPPSEAVRATSDRRLPPARDPVDDAERDQQGDAERRAERPVARVALELVLDDVADHVDLAAAEDVV